MATATDPDGTVVRVVFYDGSTRLGQADSAPYTFVWKNATPGNHLVSARAVDNAGAETASSRSCSRSAARNTQDRPSH
jgi:hypothetical protein